jgi:cytochrome bd-type quinol oxidase subunit 2
LSFFCWHYLASPAFRQQMRNRRGKTFWSYMLCYMGVLASLLITTVAAVLAIMAGWHLMNG